jgi:hypothetical protein
MKNEYSDLSRELGPQDQYNATAKDAQLLGNKLGNSILNNAGTELAELIVRYPYDSEKFYQVIAKARDVRQMIDEAKEQEKQKEQARLAQLSRAETQVRPEAGEDIPYEDFEDRSEGEPKPWFYSIMKVNRPADPETTKGVGRSYAGVPQGRTVYEVTMDNYRVKKGPTKEERFQRDTISSRLRNYLDHVVGLKDAKESVERIDFKDYYDMHYEYRDEKGRMIMMLDHHFHQNGEEEGFMLHYFLDDTKKAREIWEDVKGLIKGKAESLSQAA